MKNENLVPKVRFKGFSDPWEQRQLSELAKYRRGSFPQPYGDKKWYGGESSMPFVQVVDIADNLKLFSATKQRISKLGQPKSVFVPKGHVIIALQGSIERSIGRTAITQYDTYIDRTLLVFEKFTKKVNVKFWAYIVKRKFDIEKLGAPGSTISTITKKELSNFEICLPKYDEQVNIGCLLGLIDNLIAANEDKLEQLKTLKKLMMQKIFSQEWRFKGFTDPWEQRKLGNIASKVNEKNRNSEYRTVLTNSATKGIIRQTDYFDRKIAQNVENYYIVRDQYFIYNPRISVSAPYGPIRINRLGITGVMSPLYVVFSVNNIDNVFLEYFFKTSFWYKFMYENGDSGARADRFAIKDNTFFSMPITIPETKEQARIGKVLDRVDNLIAANEDKLNQLKKLKKYLMQNMFV